MGRYYNTLPRGAPGGYNPGDGGVPPTARNRRER